MKRPSKVRARIPRSENALRHDRSLKAQHKARRTTDRPYRWMWHTNAIRVYNSITGRTVRRINIARAGGFAKAKAAALEWLRLFNRY